MLRLHLAIVFRDFFFLIGFGWHSSFQGSFHLLFIGLTLRGWNLPSFFFVFLMNEVEICCLLGDTYFNLFVYTCAYTNIFVVFLICTYAQCKLIWFLTHLLASRKSDPQKYSHFIGKVSALHIKAYVVTYHHYCVLEGYCTLRILWEAVLAHEYRHIPSVKIIKNNFENKINGCI